MNPTSNHTQQQTSPEDPRQKFQRFMQTIANQSPEISDAFSFVLNYYSETGLYPLSTMYPNTLTTTEKHLISTSIKFGTLIPGTYNTLYMVSNDRTKQFIGIYYKQETARNRVQDSEDLICGPIQPRNITTTVLISTLLNNSDEGIHALGENFHELDVSMKKTGTLDFTTPLPHFTPRIQNVLKSSIQFGMHVETLSPKLYVVLTAPDTIQSVHGEREKAVKTATIQDQHTLVRQVSPIDNLDGTITHNQTIAQTVA